MNHGPRCNILGTVRLTMVPDSSAPIALGKVLVVGGCGFLGYHLVDQLLNFPSEDELPASNASSSQSLPRVDPALLSFPTLRSRYPVYDKTEVHVLDLRCTRNRLPGATYHQGDICDPASLLRIFRKVQPQVVLNTVSPFFDAAPDILRKVNCEGTKILLEVAGGAHGDWGATCKAFVHTSSASVVHDVMNDIANADESWPVVVPNPVEYYSETKACLFMPEAFTLLFHEPGLTNVLVGRRLPRNWCCKQTRGTMAC